MKIYVPSHMLFGTCVACRLDIDFVHSCHDSAIGKAFLLRTSANQTSLLALGLASVQASLMALAAPRIRAIRAIRVQEKIRFIRSIRVQNMYSVVLEKR